MYYTLWVICIVVGFVLLSLSIVLTFTLHIPDLIDELSGRKAKRQIKRLKELNLGTGALDRVDYATDDFYKVLGSGSLMSDINLHASRDLERTTGSLGIKLNDAEVISSASISKEEEEATNYIQFPIQEDEEATSYMQSSSQDDCDATSYMSEEATNFIGEVGDFLNDATNVDAKHSVIILEEQSSLGLN